MEIWTLISVILLTITSVSLFLLYETHKQSKHYDEMKDYMNETKDI